MNPANPILLVARRVRLLAVLAGLAWLMGLAPALPLRLLVIALVVDSLADAGRTRAPRPVRVPRSVRRRGGRR